MNDPTHPIAASPAYEAGAYGWAMAQARLIRAGGLRRIDWQRIAEEIEDVGRSQYDGLEAALRVLLVHLLKWEHQPLLRSRSWLLTIREQHRQFERRLARNSGLKGSLEDIREEAYRQAVIAVQAETGLAVETFSMTPPAWNLIDDPAADESGIPPR